MEKDIGKLKKNEQTDIVVRIDDFGGKKGLTIREFVTSDRYTGFTKSGVRIAASDFKDFKEMINSIDESELEESDEEEMPKDQQKLDEAEEEKKEDSESSDNEPSKDELPDY